MKGILYVGGVVVALVVGLYAGYQGLRQEGFGSVAQSNEYNVTTTGSQFTTPPEYSFTTDPATLGSVVITGANSGKMDFYNATTTNKNLRTGQAATSTILVASIPASLAAGTYVFDVKAPNGLLMVSSGSLATSTITWR
jgi:hypothetical protein